MSLSEDVDLEEFITTKDDLSGADIKAVCTEAGLLALRERRMRVTKADFTTAREKVNCISSGKTLHRTSLIILLRFPGVIQEERGHSRGTVFVDYVCTGYLSLPFICYVHVLIQYLNLIYDAVWLRCTVIFTLHEWVLDLVHVWCTTIACLSVVASPRIQGLNLNHYPDHCQAH